MSPASPRRTAGRFGEFYPYATERQMIKEKRDCQKMVARALANGTLVRSYCAVCGKFPAEAHHEDYRKPLNVDWLCRLHHRLRDAAITRSRAKRLKELHRIKARVPFGMAPSQRARRSTMNNPSAVTLVMQATQAISDEMDRQEMPEIVVAERMKVSRQVVNTQFAGGFRSLKIVAAYADALGCVATIVLTPRLNEKVEPEEVEEELLVGTA